jgi:hypothetical protein
MLPFGVIKIEQHRAIQQKPAPLFLPNICRPEFPLLNRSSTGSRHAKLDRQIADPVPDRSSRRAFTIVSAQNTCCLTQKNDPVLPKWASTSNRNWTKNRSYRKQTTKPCLTGTRTHIRLSPNFAKTAHDFATFESENTELPLWDPLWKTRRFLQSDRPLPPGSAQYIECDVTYSKQTTASFLPGATTISRDRTNFDQSQQRW